MAFADVERMLGAPIVVVLGGPGQESDAMAQSQDPGRPVRQPSVSTSAVAAMLGALLVSLLAGCGAQGAKSDTGSHPVQEEAPTAVAPTPSSSAPLTTTTAPPTTTTAPPTTTTEPPPPDIKSVDLASVTYLVTCPSVDGAEVEIVPKNGPTPTAGGSVELSGELKSVFGDITGDGRDDAVVTLSCIATGGNGQVSNVVLVTSERGGARQVGPAVEGFDPAIVGSVVAVGRAVYAETDAQCCPTTIRYLPLLFARDHLAEGGAGGKAVTNADVATTTGIGGFQVGRPYAEIAATTGQPISVTDDLQTEGTCVSVSIEGGPEELFGLGDAEHLGSVEFSSDAIKTKSGLGIGSTEAEVYRAFGDRVRSDPHDYLVPDGHYLTFIPNDDPGHVVVFDTDGSTVTHFRVGEDSWAHAIEGCA